MSTTTSTTTTSINRSEPSSSLDEIRSEVDRPQEEERSSQQNNQDNDTTLTTSSSPVVTTTTTTTTTRTRQEHDPATRNLLIQAIRAIMQAAATIFGLGVGVGLILGDSLRTRPLVVTNSNIALEERMPGVDDDDVVPPAGSPEQTPQGEISARPPPTEPLPSCCGRSMYRARSNVQEAPPSSTTAALLPAQ